MFSERFASIPPSSLPRSQEGDGANRRGTERNNTTRGGLEEERRREIRKRGEAEDESYIYIEGERIQIAQESSGALGPRTIASDLSERAEQSAAPPHLVDPVKQSLTMKSSLLLLFFVHLAYAAIGRHHRDSGFLNHVQLVHEFRCSVPQPRAVPVTELLTIGPSPDEFFFPAATVLTRCDGAGCCPDPKQICAPIETRNVSLVFMVKHVIDRQRDRHHEVIHALEHTKCGCVDKKLIKFD